MGELWYRSIVREFMAATILIGSLRDCLDSDAKWLMMDLKRWTWTGMDEAGANGCTFSTSHKMSAWSLPLSKS